jgi:hypothetical protein
MAWFNEDDWIDEKYHPATRDREPNDWAREDLIRGMNLDIKRHCLVSEWSEKISRRAIMQPTRKNRDVNNKLRKINDKRTSIDKVCRVFSGSTYA